MLKLVMLSVFLGMAWGNPVILTTEVKTPASTAKLAPFITPLASPLVAPVSHLAYSAHHLLPQVAPYAYAYSAPLAPVAYAAPPASYSIEQHGYNIAY